MTILGFTNDGPWDMPGLGPHLQFTCRNSPAKDPCAGATFYIPVSDASKRRIMKRAKQVRADFQQNKKQARIKVQTALANCNYWKRLAEKGAAAIVKWGMGK